MKLTNLARSKTETKKESNICKAPGGDQFGYGTRLRFDKEDLKKLGLKLGDMNVGDVFEGEFVAEVINVSSNKGQDYDSSSLELQITKIGLEAETELESAIDSAIEEANE